METTSGCRVPKNAAGCLIELDTFSISLDTVQQVPWMNVELLLTYMNSPTVTCKEIVGCWGQEIRNAKLEVLVLAAKSEPFASLRLQWMLMVGLSPQVGYVFHYCNYDPKYVEKDNYYIPGATRLA